MAKLLLEPVNFLILDEPTNHLDMRTKEVLKTALKDFNGTVIIVSHDRDFLDGLVDKVYEFGGGKVREHIGGIYDYLKKRDSASLKVGISAGNELNLKKESTPSNATLSYQQKKEFDRALRKAEKKVNEAENRIEEIESSIADLENKMSQGIVDDEILKNYGDKKKELDEITDIWELAQNELDDLKTQYGYN